MCFIDLADKTANSCWIWTDTKLTLNLIQQQLNIFYCFQCNFTHAGTSRCLPTNWVSPAGVGDRMVQSLELVSAVHATLTWSQWPSILHLTDNQIISTYCIEVGYWTMWLHMCWQTRPSRTWVGYNSATVWLYKRAGVGYLNFQQLQVNSQPRINNQTILVGYTYCLIWGCWIQVLAPTSRESST